MSTSRDETFRAFTPAQAAQYARGRGQAYPPTLYNAIFDFHQGPRHLLLDVGSGPGKVVFNLLPSFDRGIGSDVSPEMIKQAEIDAQKLGATDRTSFVVCGGEECDQALSSVPASSAGGVDASSAAPKADVLTVAMAVHWFDMPRFYAAAARALRPGGTLALWTTSGFFAHPSTPHHAEVQKTLSFMEDEVLGPYMEPGNAMSKTAYEHLPLPWTLNNEPSLAELFPQSRFVRKDWDRNGVPSAPKKPDGSPGDFIQSIPASLDMVNVAMSSASPVVRWRAAHPEQANTSEDPVVRTVTRLKEILGPDAKFVGSPSFSLLLFRRA